MLRAEKVLELSGYPVKQAEAYLSCLQAMPPGDFSGWQEHKKWDIFLHHFEHNPFYREILKTFPATWTDIPIMTKSHFQRPLRSLISTRYTTKDVYVGNTSGSSGHPFFYAKDRFSHALTWMTIKRLYGQYGLSLDSKQARFYGIPLELKGYWKERAKDWLINRVRFPVFDLSSEVLDRWVRRFKKERFEYLYGYTSSLVHFARHCLDRGVVLKDVCPTLKVCIVTSEVCTEEDREILSKGFGVRVVNEYGASETGIIAFEDPTGHWRINEIELFVEIVDEEGRPLREGQPGRILITSLHNRAMPIIRYEIGDIGVIKSVDGVKVLDSLLGRTNDMIRLPSGRVSPGLTFYYISRSLLERHGSIREFIIKQTALDTFEFVIHGTRKITEKEDMEIRRCMDRYLEPGLKLVIREVDRIERPSSGKIKHFYSLL